MLLKTLIIEAFNSLIAFIFFIYFFLYIFCLCLRFVVNIIIQKALLSINFIVNNATCIRLKKRFFIYYFFASC